MISVILPTSGRKDRVVACVNRLFGTTQGYDIEVIAVVDNDMETFNALQEIPKVRVDYSDEYRGIPNSLNAGLVLAQGEYLVLAADDLVWGDGWLDEAMRVMMTLGPQGGLVGFNDGYFDGNGLATHYIASRWFVVNHLNGVMGFPCYKYCANDSEATERAIQVGLYKWAKNAYVKHEMPIGMRDRDALDDRNRVHANHDGDLFLCRKKLGFPNDFDPVITR